MLSFHGNPTCKKRLLKTLAKHRKADAIIQGTYGRRGGKFKGCAIGCTIVYSAKDRQYAGFNTEFEKRYGIPAILASLEENIFENFTDEKDWKAWPQLFIESLPVGIDLSTVLQDMCLDLLRTPRVRKSLIARINKPIYDSLVTLLKTKDAALQKTRAADIDRLLRADVCIFIDRFIGSISYILDEIGSFGVTPLIAYSILMLLAGVVDEEGSSRATTLRGAFIRVTKKLSRLEKKAPAHARFLSLQAARVVDYKKIPPVYRPLPLEVYRRKLKEVF